MPNNNIHIAPISQNEYNNLCSNNAVDNNVYYTVIDNSDIISGTKTFSCYDPMQKLNYLENEVKMLKETISDLLNKQKFDD